MIKYRAGNEGLPIILKGKVWGNVVNDPAGKAYCFLFYLAYDRAHFIVVPDGADKLVLPAEIIRVPRTKADAQGVYRLVVKIKVDIVAAYGIVNPPEVKGVEVHKYLFAVIAC